MNVGTRMNLANELCHPRNDSSRQLSLGVVVDGNKCDSTNLCRHSSKKHINNRKSLRQKYPQANPNKKVSAESTLRLNQMNQRSEVGHLKDGKRTQQRSNHTRPHEQPPVVVLNGKEYDLSNLCINNSIPIEKGSLERMCSLDRMIRKGKILCHRKSERSQRPPVVIVDGEQRDISNLYRDCTESLYPDLSHLFATETDNAQKMSRLHQKIRSTQVHHDRFRERSQQMPPVIVLDGKEYDLSNLCSSSSKSNVDSNESIVLELPGKSPRLKESRRHEEFAVQHAGGGQEEEEVWQVDFPLHEITITFPQAEVESIATDESFQSFDFSCRGPLETIKALGKECFACAECMKCAKPLHCTDNAELVLCPKCQRVGVKAYGIKGGRCDSPFPKNLKYGLRVEEGRSGIIRRPSYRLKQNCPSS